MSRSQLSIETPAVWLLRQIRFSSSRRARGYKQHAAANLPSCPRPPPQEEGMFPQQHAAPAGGTLLRAERWECWLTPPHTPPHCSEEFVKIPPPSRATFTTDTTAPSEGPVPLRVERPEEVTSWVFFRPQCEGTEAVCHFLRASIFNTFLDNLNSFSDFKAVSGLTQYITLHNQALLCVC